MAPLREELATKRGEPTRELEERQIRSQLADDLIRVLKVGDLDAADKTLNTWIRDTVSSIGVTTKKAYIDMVHQGENQESPAARVVVDVLDVLAPLLFAFRDPTHFFQEVAPLVDIHFFPTPESEAARATLMQGPEYDVIREWMKRSGDLGCTDLVARTLHVWGLGALSNPLLRMVFDGLTPLQKTFVLAVADERPVYMEGRAKGRTDSKPRPRRVDVAQESTIVDALARKIEDARGWAPGSRGLAVRVRAKQLGLKPSTIKRRKFPRSPPKNRKLPRFRVDPFPTSLVAVF